MVEYSSDLPLKQREASRDCLRADDWGATPALAEQAYRRGFAQGVAQAVYALQSGASARELEEWVFGPVRRWRYQDKMRCEMPPEAPYRDAPNNRRVMGARPRQPEAEWGRPMSIAELIALRDRKANEPLSDQELHEIRQRCIHATPGGWIAAREHPEFGTIGGPVCYMDEDERIVVGQPGDWGPTNDPWDDAEFIAHARSDVPRLLAEVERLRNGLAEGGVHQTTVTS